MSDSLPSSTNGAALHVSKSNMSKAHERPSGTENENSGVRDASHSQGSNIEMPPPPVPLNNTHVNATESRPRLSSETRHQRTNHDRIRASSDAEMLVSESSWSSQSAKQQAHDAPHDDDHSSAPSYGDGIEFADQQMSGSVGSNQERSTRLEFRAFVETSPTLPLSSSLTSAATQSESQTSGFILYVLLIWRNSDAVALQAVFVNGSVHDAWFMHATGTNLQFQHAIDAYILAR